jgi:hypothetical protein
MRLTQFIERHNIRFLIFLTLLTVTCVNFNQVRWTLKDVIQHDIAHYHSYLPAFFYEKDLKLTFLEDTVNQKTESQLYAPNRTPEGNPVIKMSMGMAISYLPFFALAHAYCMLSDLPANGFSEPYHFALLFSSLAYYVIGLFFLWRILRRYFPANISTLTLFCITFATNVFYYLTMGAAMSHIVNFTVVAIFLYYTILWYESYRWKYAIAVGLAGGFLTLIRPINFLFFIFFFSYGLGRLSDLAAKTRLLREKRRQIIALVFLAFLVVLPQLLYWKHVTGHFFFNSYVGEHFYFLNPHVKDALIGFRKGWLVYTPIMTFAIVGFFWLRERIRPLFLASVVLFLLYIYVAFSWWCWWYGGSFGQRVLIDLYPLLSIPFALFLMKIRESSKQIRILSCCLIVFFTALNLFQSMQAKYNIIHYDSMTAQAYFRVFGTVSKAPDREKYLGHPDYERAKRGEDE